jgi:hypothetical protein
MTNTYIFTISWYTVMNERGMAIRIREKRNETVNLERAIIDEPVVNRAVCGL